MNRVKICQVSSVHPSTDTRVFFKECKALAEAGYNVVLIARDKGSARTESGVEIVPFHLYTNRFKRMLFSPFRMLRMALKEKAAIYHFHDPELIFVGLMLKLFGKKVIYDVHEDVPKQIMGKSYIRSLLFRRVLSSVVKTVEKTAALFFDRIITATGDIALHFNPLKTTVVRNLPVLQLMAAPAALDIVKEKPAIVYVGVLSRIRGLVEIVQAMEYVGPKAELWLVGSWERDELYEECRKLKGWQYVRFFGPKPQKEAYTYMRNADIGIVNFHPLPNHVNALPNKIFEYMALALPLVLSNFPSWVETFADYAVFADPYDPKDIADKISTLLENRDLRTEKGRKGKKSIDSGYSWEHEKNVLLHLYRDMTGK